MCPGCKCRGEPGSTGVAHYKFETFELGIIDDLPDCQHDTCRDGTKDRSPWPENLPLPRQAVIYDLVYNPSETKFVKDARLQGLSATNGFGMLVEQAALSFELWTGQKPSRDVMFDAANQTAH